MHLKKENDVWKQNSVLVLGVFHFIVAYEIYFDLNLFLIWIISESQSILPDIQCNWVPLTIYKLQPFPNKPFLVKVDPFSLFSIM